MYAIIRGTDTVSTHFLHWVAALSSPLASHNEDGLLFGFCWSFWVDRRKPSSAFNSRHVVSLSESGVPFETERWVEREKGEITVKSQDTTRHDTLLFIQRLLM